MAHFWRFSGPAFAASHVQQISDMHSKFALRPHHMCESVVDIQSPTAETRRGKKEEERRRRKKKKMKIETTGQKYNVRTYYIGRP